MLLRRIAGGNRLPCIRQHRFLFKIYTSTVTIAMPERVSTPVADTAIVMTISIGNRKPRAATGRAILAIPVTNQPRRWLGARRSPPQLAVDWMPTVLDRTGFAIARRRVVERSSAGIDPCRRPARDRGVPELLPPGIPEMGIGPDDATEALSDQEVILNRVADVREFPLRSMTYEVLPVPGPCAVRGRVPRADRPDDPRRI